MVYPLTIAEERMIRWASRVVPLVAIAIIGFLGALSVA